MNAYVISLLAICVFCLWNGYSCPFSVYLALLICGSTLWFKKSTIFFHICRKHILPVHCLPFSFYFIYFFAIVNDFFFQDSCYVYRKILIFISLWPGILLNSFLALRVFSLFSLGFFGPIIISSTKWREGWSEEERKGGGRVLSPPC